MRKPKVQNTSPNASRNPLWYTNGSTQDRGQQSNNISPNSTWGNLGSTAVSVKLQMDYDRVDKTRGKKKKKPQEIKNRIWLPLV